jgi:hypothetical protein
VKLRATVWCGACQAERRPRPGKLGEVAEIPGRLLWHGYHDPSAQALRNFDGQGDPPEARHYWSDLSGDTPDTLPVWCSRKHGSGIVLSSAVIAARGKVFLEFTATG